MTDTANWYAGVDTSDEHVDHMVAALRSMRASPGVERQVLVGAAAMLHVMATELRQWRAAHEMSAPDGDCAPPTTNNG